VSWPEEKPCGLGKANGDIRDSTYDVTIIAADEAHGSAALVGRRLAKK
jgi:hypothetical protein